MAGPASPARVRPLYLVADRVVFRAENRVG
jgi:hypothetical protein